MALTPASSVSTGGLVVAYSSTLAAPAASIDSGVSAIPATGNVLEIIFIGRTSQAVVTSSIVLRINGDSGANYDREGFGVTNATLSGGPTLAATSWTANVPGTSVQAGSAGYVRTLIPSYAATTFHKVGEQFEAISDSAAANNEVTIRGMRWRSTAAINQVSVTAGSGNLVAGSQLLLLVG